MWFCGLRRPRRYVASRAVDTALISSQQAAAAGQHAFLEAKAVVRAPEASNEVTGPQAQSGSVLQARPGAAGHTHDEVLLVVQPDGKKQTSKAEPSMSVAPLGGNEGTGDAVFRALLNQLCYPVTLVDSDGVVVLQNEASR